MLQNRGNPSRHPLSLTCLPREPKSSQTCKKCVVFQLLILIINIDTQEMAHDKPGHEPYSSLRRDVEEFRLFTIESGGSADEIRCKIGIHEFAGCPPYEALSYAWGGTDCTEQIYLNDTPFNVTKNLFAALSQLRRRAGSRHLWIDAICIDQSSVSEKNHQVALMGMIYSGAEQVLVWLGEQSENSKQAIGFIERWHDGICTLRSESLDEEDPLTEDLISALASIERPFDEADINAVSDLLSREYWSRIWIVHEIILGRSRLLLCGNQELLFDKLSTVLTFWSYIVSFDSASWCAYDGAVSILVANLRCHPPIIFTNEIIRRTRAARQEGRAYKPDITYLLYNFRFSLATDTRDKIFGILGLLDPEKMPIQVDYSLTLTEVCRIVTAHLISQQKNLGVVGWGGVGMKEPNLTPVDPNWPSWVPDFTAIERMNLTHSMMFQASKDRPAICDFPSPTLLRVTAVRCDEIAHVSPRLGSELVRDGDLSWIWSWIKLAENHYEEAPHPTGLPWRQAFFRTIVADDDSTGYDKPEFESQKAERSFFAKAEGFITCLRMLALEKIRILDSEENPPSADLETFLSCDINEPLDIFRAVEVGIICQEAALWILMSSKTTDEALRRRVLEKFCGMEGASNRLNWPFTEFGCTSRSANFNAFITSTRLRASGLSFFITRNGYCGMGQGYLNENDQICIFLGAPAPMIVRKTSAHHVIVSDANIFGMMLGEMIDQMDDGKLGVEDLIIQ